MPTLKSQLCHALLPLIITGGIVWIAPPIREATAHALSLASPVSGSQNSQAPPIVLREKKPRTNNPISNEKILLGKELYFDKRLSSDGTVSCATCHDPAAAFTSKEALAIGINGQKGTRNAPTLLNSVFSESYFWDGRVRTLEEQVKQPLLNPAEMGVKDEAALIKRLNSIDEYRLRFRRIFPRTGITLETVAKAIAAYERTLLSNDAPFDRFIAGDSTAINENQRRGWELFRGKAKCIECHAFSTSSPLFTDSKFYNTGITTRSQDLEDSHRLAEKIRLSRRGDKLDPSLLAHQPEFSDLGRFLVTNELKDVGAFKTPTLRDVELTGPYMHNGSIKTLLDVVRFYNRGGEKNPNVDEKMRVLNLNEKEMSELVEFMRSLTSDAVLRQVQSSTPQNRNPVLVSPVNVVKRIR